MSAIKRIPRGLRVLITIVILAVLIWFFARNTAYFYYSIGAAVLITAIVIYFTYRKPSSGKRSNSSEEKQLPAESDQEIGEAEIEAETLNDVGVSESLNANMEDQPRSPQESINVESAGESPIPLIEDPSSLTQDEKNLLVNAVWYRCENPYCKFTSFLSVHHIVEEKVGGSNKLNNLIVLCPYCHDLAHRGEIPEKEMLGWIEDRAERWKFKPQWKYF